MKRCFVGLVVPDTTALALQTACAGAERNFAACAPPRWVPRENLHLTLKFLGDVPDAALAPLKQALATLSAKHSPSQVQLKGMGVFGGARPRALYAHVAHGRDTVVALMAAVHAAAAPWVVPAAEGARVPHVTLARWSRGAACPAAGECEALLQAQAGAVYGPVDGSQVVLFQSVLRGEGAHYAPLSTWPLTAL